MIGRSFRVATIFGIPIKVDLSWLVIVVLLTATMAAAFSRDHPSLGWPSWFLMGLASAMLLFGSVLAHELSHALVALREGIGIRGITLFIFGGAAEMIEEPPNAKAELKVAVAGPAMSLALAVGFGSLYSVGLGWFHESVLGVVKYLALMNAILVAFNLVPGFPLDGGRVLRAVLWGIWGNLRYATRTASVVGSGFGVLIMLLGLVYVLPFGNLIGGIWYLFIGFFLRNAARHDPDQTFTIHDRNQCIVAHDHGKQPGGIVLRRYDLLENISPHDLPRPHLTPVRALDRLDLTKPEQTH